MQRTSPNSNLTIPTSLTANLQLIWDFQLGQFTLTRFDQKHEISIAICVNSNIDLFLSTGESFLIGFDLFFLFLLFRLFLFAFVRLHSLSVVRIRVHVRVRLRLRICRHCCARGIAFALSCLRPVSARAQRTRTRRTRRTTATQRAHGTSRTIQHWRVARLSGQYFQRIIAAWSRIVTA